jgi:hypothetical protein
MNTKKRLALSLKVNEKFSESWERLKDLLIKCPPHGYE